MHHTTNTARPTTIARNQQGFASLAIALVLILVLALLSVAFAQLSRREQQSALSKQLSSQAYYAAESGINDVYSDIKSGAINKSNASRTACMKPPATAKSSHGVIDSTSGLSYNCVLVSLSPPALAWTKVAKQSSRMAVFSSDSGSPLRRFIVAWSSSDGRVPQTGFGAGFQPDTASGWGNHMAVLQVSVTPISSTRDGFTGGTYSFFAYPTTSAHDVANYSTDVNQQGKILGGGCTASNGLCGISVAGLPGASPDQEYLVRITTYYDDGTEMNLQQAYDANNNQTSFANGQAQIDVTGKAKNVSKRLLVRLPLTKMADTLPNDALEVQNVCKHIQAKPASADDPSGSSYVKTEGAGTATATCNLGIEASP